MDGELPRYTDPELEPANETLRRRSTHSNLRSSTSLERRSTSSSWSSWPGNKRRSSRSQARASSSREEVVLETDEDDEDDDHEPASGSTRQPRSTLPSDFFEMPSGMKRTPSDRLSFEDSDPLESPADDPIDNSPFEQVRASVKATDDLSLSISTPRMWILGLVFAVLGSSTNLFFSLRYPSVTLTPVVALLLVHPLGLLWDHFLKRPDDPKENFVNGFLECHTDRSNGHENPQDESRPPSRRRRLRLWLAQGTWNEKEHACVYIAANVSFGFAFATDVIVEQTKFYHQQTSWVYQISLVLSTQILGYSLAGLCKNLLVWPSGMVWPGTLMASSMFSTLHGEIGESTRNNSRWRFFLFVFFGTFGFYFLPGLVMPALSYFNVITWFAPENVVVTSLFGVSSGLGMFPVTFDWAQIAYTGSPLLTPFWAAMNVLGGLVIVMWIVAPIMYYSNALYSAFMPILSAQVFDNTARPYDVKRILGPDYLLDERAYKDYSPVFLPITYALSYGIQFASMTALLTHTACWHGREIWHQLRGTVAAELSRDETKYQPLTNPTASESASQEQLRDTTPSPSRSERHDPDHILNSEDVHNRLMKRYPEVPHMWYLLMAIVTMAVGMFVVEFYETVHLPWWGLILALGICIILFIPIGIVFAVSNLQISIYLVSQIAAGFIFPGRGVANLIFVTYSYITSTQGLKFAADLKLGHYMKVPPRLLFNVQLYATIVSSLSQILVLNWMLSNIPNICTPEAINGFTCPIARVHFQGSILYGAINPSRFFGSSALYHPLVWAFPLGAIAPVVAWYIAKKRDSKTTNADAVPTSSIWNLVNFPVIFGSLSWIPPATGLNFSVWAVLCFTFNYVIKNRHKEWWKRYTMTLSAALDAGVAFGVLVIFFGVVYPGFSEGFSWWGTEIYKQGCDWVGCPYKVLKEGERFGPSQW